MKAVILAGGRGTRLSEETRIIPKPLVDAAGRPLIWHIMKNYAIHGVTEFVILAGYKAEEIKKYFADFWLLDSDVTFEFSDGHKLIHESKSPNWKVTILDTGIETQTGGRLKRAAPYLNSDFFLTYGDGVSDVDLTSLKEIHIQNGNLLTLTAVQPPARFGALVLSDNQVIDFKEKVDGEESWVNGGYFVVNPIVLSRILGDSSILEVDVLPELARSGKLGFYKHEGFWQPVDTMRDLERLRSEIADKKLPWMN